MRQLLRSARGIVCGLVLLTDAAMAAETHNFVGTEPDPGPNIIVIISDDYAWPYYGFMQEYLERNQQHGTHGGAYAEDLEVFHNKFRYGMLLPDDGETAVTPKLGTIITPALDSLARGHNPSNGNHYGHYFPIAHLGASICKPGLATELTGLHLADLNRNQLDDGGPYISSPVMPEHLQGFVWSNVDKRPQVTTAPQYLTMGAGKWRYSQDTFRFDDGAAPPADCDASAATPLPPCGANVDKYPFDYDLETGSDSVGTREILEGRLREVKDFIDCTLCVNDEATCAPEPGYEVSPRLANWKNLCEGRDGAAATPAKPRPFFVVYNALMPHDPLHVDQYCPDFDATQCTNAAEPWYGQHSVYCNHPTENDYTCAEFSEDLFAIGCDLEDSDPDRNIFSDPQQCGTAPPYVDADFQRKANYLRFINTFDRTVDEILVHLKRRNVYDKTIVLVLTDNGATGTDMLNSKGQFGENGYRTPFIVYDPYSAPQPTPAPGATGCSAAQGCRSDLAQFPDLIRTIRNAQADYAAAKSLPAPALGTPLPQSKRTKMHPTAPDPYSEAYDLRRGSAQGFGAAGRACPASAPSGYRQCLFGHEKSGSAPQSTQPGPGWYVLAEIESGGVRHLCKYYHEGSGTAERLYALLCDPNEQINLKQGPANQPDYDAGYCHLAGDDGLGNELCERERGNLIRVLHDEVVCRRKWSVETDWDDLSPAPPLCSS
jgi:hypothetical protein